LYNLSDSSMSVYDVSSCLGVDKIFNGQMINAYTCIAQPGQNNAIFYYNDSLEQYLILFDYMQCSKMDTVYCNDGRIAYPPQSE
ncbi:MAG: hypothetical protein ABIJ45_14725, partial [Candidatus Zixiibacteriota bacterium]